MLKRISIEENHIDINNYLKNLNKASELEPINKEANDAITATNIEYGLFLKKQGKKEEGSLKIKEAGKSMVENAVIENDTLLVNMVAASKYLESKQPQFAINVLKNFDKSHPLADNARGVLASSYVLLSEKQIEKEEFMKCRESLIIAKDYMLIIKKNKTYYIDDIKDLDKMIDDAINAMDLPLAKNKIEEKDYNTAIKILESHLKYFPNEKPEISSFIGYSLFRKGKVNEGFNEIKKALVINSQNPIIYFNLARMYSLNKNKQFALDNLKKSIKIDKNFKLKAIEEKDFYYLIKEIKNIK